MTMNDDYPPPTTDRGRLRVVGFGDRDPGDGPGAGAERDGAESRDAAPSAASVGRRRRTWRRIRGDRAGVAGLFVVVLLAFLAVFARPVVVAGVPVQPFALAPYDPGAAVGPAGHPPSVAHPFGTDWAGRDVLSRVLYGGRYSLTVGLAAVSLAVAVGVALGSLAGYAGGWVDELLMRVVDVLYSFPFLVLAIAFVALFGQGFWNLVAALAVVGWAGYARLVRGEVLGVVEEEYVLAARALGASDRRILARHVVPNAVGPVLVQATLNVGSVVLSAAALGFLGLGLEPGTAEWGSMLANTRSSLLQGRWWVTLFPGLAVLLFVLAVNLVGDALRDALDPRGAGRRGR